MGYPKGAGDAEIAFDAQTKISAYIEEKNAGNLFKRGASAVKRGSSALRFAGEKFLGEDLMFQAGEAMEYLGGPTGLILMEAMHNLGGSMAVQQDVDYDSLKDYYVAQFSNSRFRESHTSVAGGNEQTYFTDADRASMEGFNSNMGTAMWMDTVGEWSGYHISEEEMSKRASNNIYKYHPESKYYTIKGRSLEDTVYSDDLLAKYYDELDYFGWYKERYDPKDKYNNHLDGYGFDPNDPEQVKKWINRDGGALQNYQFQQSIKHDVLDKLEPYKRSKEHRGGRLENARAGYDYWMEQRRKRSYPDDYRNFEVSYYLHPGFRQMLHDEGIDPHEEYERLWKKSGHFDNETIKPTLEEFPTDRYHQHFKQKEAIRKREALREKYEAEKRKITVYDNNKDFGSVTGKNKRQIINVKTGKPLRPNYETGDVSGIHGTPTPLTGEDDISTAYPAPPPHHPDMYDDVLPPAPTYSAHPGGSSDVPPSRSGVVIHMGKHPGHTSGTPTEQHGGTKGHIQPTDGTTHTTDHLTGFTGDTGMGGKDDEYHNHDAYNPVQNSTGASTKDMPSTSLPESQLELLTQHYQSARGKRLRSFGAHNTENLAFIADAAAAARRQRSSYNR